MRVKKLCGLLATMTLASCAETPDVTQPSDHAPSSASSMHAIGTSQQPLLLVRTPGTKIEDDVVTAMRARLADAGLSSAVDDFKVLSIHHGVDGLDHVRLQQMHRGVPVWGGDIVVHAGANDFHGAGGNVAALRPVDTMPSLQGSDALATAKTDYSRGAKQGVSLGYASEAQELVILPSANGAANLAWHVTFFTEAQADLPEGRWNYFIDAHDGSIVRRFNAIMTEQASGPGGNARVSRYWNANLPVTKSGSVYVMDTAALETNNLNHAGDTTTNPGGGGGDPNCGPLPCVKSALAGGVKPAGIVEALGSPFSSSSLTFSDRAGDDAHGFTQVTLNMMRDWFGFNSIDNAGYKILSRVHYGAGFDNAGWNGSDIKYGDGDGATFYAFSGGLDIVAHEIHHGFTEKHSNLVYEEMSGGMNESFSDIAGVSAEFYYNPSSATFNIGSDILVQPNQALRYMCDPTLDGQSIDNAANYTSAIDVHYSSGVMNKAFCRAARRLSGADPVTGTATADGVHMAARAWYAANASYWTSSSTFTQGCQGVVDAALALGYTPAQAQLIGQSWGEVGVACNYPNLSVVPGDFNNDGKSDVLVFNTQSGQFNKWYGDATTSADFVYQATRYVGGSPGLLPGAQVITGDFNGDHSADALVYRSSDGQFYKWYGTGTVSPDFNYQAVRFNGGAAGAVPDAQVIPGDFNGDGKTDILVFRSSDGLFAKWYGSDTVSADFNYQASHYVGGTAGAFPGLKVITGDFNGDGKTDVLLYRPSDGLFFKWYGSATISSDFNYQAARYIGGGAGLYPDMEMVAGDFNHDTYTDVVAYRSSDGQFFKWYGSATISPDFNYQLGRYIGGAAGAYPGMRLISGDFDGDGSADIVGYRSSDGLFFKWYGSTTISPDFNYQVARYIGGAANVLPNAVMIPMNFNGDASTDIVVFRQSDGAFYKWYGTGTVSPDFNYQALRHIGG